LSQRVRRIKKINAIKAAAESERTALIIHNAKQETQKEREMSEYLSHEVRNPLTASICAAHNLSLLAKDLKPGCCSTVADVQTVKEDIDVIQSSLTHINDLLRSMLDMHKVASNQLKIDLVSTEIMKDVFEPVKTIVYRANDDYDMQIDCPADLVVLTDRLRLKQIVLNLAVNSKKFVQRGFIRLAAAVVEGRVEISIEDTGPGIPMEKRPKLFDRFQESLDSLCQGTGMGLALSKKLADLMGYDFALDDSYDSGIEGCPGARFVLRLNTPPMVTDSLNAEFGSSSSSMNNRVDEADALVPVPEPTTELPGELSVLVVDDDMIIRKMLSRSLKRLAPSWKIQEASNGETAIQLAAKENFDLIFLDHFMASIHKQLLGTETAQTLRTNGCASRICGLSANDMKDAFLKAGADAFMLKPFPCDSHALKMEIMRVLGLSSVPGEPGSMTCPLSGSHHGSEDAGLDRDHSVAGL
jgi:CheY-like chemotaxis protein